MNDMSFNEAIELAKSIQERFKKIEGKPWGVEGAMMELSKQVGELSKLVMTYEKYYYQDGENNRYAVSKEKIGDELADILYAIIMIAIHYNIDLLDAHIEASKDEDRLLKSKGV